MAKSELHLSFFACISMAKPIRETQETCAFIFQGKLTGNFHFDGAGGNSYKKHESM